MSASIYFKRLDKLRNIIKSSSNALFITDEINIGYFCGFYHSEGAMLVTVDCCYLLVDFRYIEAAQKYADGCKIICFKNLFSEVSLLIDKHHINQLFFEASKITVSRFNQFCKIFNENGTVCISTDLLDNRIAELRMIKDECEYEKLLKAQQIAEKSYLEVLNYIKPGVSEREIALELEYLMKKNGAERVSFDLITITGKKTSLPHGVPSDDVIKAGDFFTMDFGAVFEGYHSDTTRTIAVGSATEEMQYVYSVVLDAQLSVLDKVKSGAVCSEIDSIARNIIKKAGYGKFFGHATGHGVGLDIHEAPTVSPKSEIILQEGMVITDEPGIYLPDKFGVRIEDMLYVTKDGYKNFVSLPKELIIV